MIVVIDTNILISGIFWKGKPYKILELWMKNEFDLIITQEILTEYIEVIYERRGNTIKCAPYFYYKINDENITIL